MRKRLSYGKSRRVFRKGTKVKNMNDMHSRPMRGGFRL